MAKTPAPSAEAAPAPTTIGPYLLEREIGSGGMGTVHLARHRETGQKVALKVLPPSLSREEGFIARFQREVSALQKLKNPHVVALYDSGVDGDLYYYAMEYVAGQTLAEKIRAVGRIDWKEAIEIAVQVCSALKAAHDAGIIHRDLKPSNLLLAEDGTVKLTDFGVAQVFAGTRLTKTGGVIGTVEYMSPEQARGGRVTKKSDLYSLGAVLYAMLTGRPPFTGKTSLEVIQKHQHARFDRPRLYVPHLPVWLDDLVCQLLEKEPDKRPPDAYVLSRRLQGILRKVELSLQEETIAAENRPSGDLARTVAAGAEKDKADSGISRGPGLGTLMRDAVRDELERAAEPGLLGRILNNTWVLVGLLLLLIAGGVWWWQSRTLSPEEQFEAGVALMKEKEGESWRKARDDYFAPLLQQDPEHWRPKIAPYLKRIQRYELKQRIAAARRKGKRKRPVSEPERFLFLAVELQEQGQLAEAERILAALKTLTAGRPDDEAVHQLATELLDEIRRERAKSRTASSLLQAALDKAERHRQKGELMQARALWRSVLELYGNDPSLQSEISKVRRLLRDHPGPVSSKGTTEK